MRNLIALLLMLSYSNCSNNYESITKGLSKNDVLLYEEIEKDLYFEYFKLDEKEHAKKAIEYEKAVNNFYKSDVRIIDYLLEYEKDTIQICTWIKTKNPYSSDIVEADILTKSKGALILIDNYLSNNNIPQKIETPLYINNLSYKKFLTFYNKNRHLKNHELRKAYSNFLKKNYQLFRK